MPRNIRTGGIKPIKTIQQVQEVEVVSEQIPQLVGIISVEDKPTLVAMLKRSGSLVTEQSTQKELLDASFKALKDSNRFRKDLADYIKGKAMAEDFGNFVDDDMYANFEKYDPKTGTGGSRVGNILRGIFTKENVSALTDAGIGAFSTSLQNKAAKRGNQQAIDFERAKAETAIAQAQLEATRGGGVGTKATSRKWVLPVAIIGGLLVVGTVIFLAVRKK